MGDVEGVEGVGGVGGVGGLVGGGLASNGQLRASLQAQELHARLKPETALPLWFLAL